MRRHITTLDAISEDALNLAGEFAYEYIRDRNKRDGTVDTRIKHVLHKAFVREHNLLVAEYDKDTNIQMHRAFQAILHGWSTTSLRAFRLAVCE